MRTSCAIQYDASDPTVGCRPFPLQGRRSPTAMLLSYVAAGALLLLYAEAAFLVYRRLSAAIERAPSAADLSIALLLLLPLSTAARCAWSLSRSGRIACGTNRRFGLAVTAGSFAAGLALSFVETPLPLRVAFWAALIADSGLWLLPWHSRGERDSASIEPRDNVEPSDGSKPNDNVTLEDSFETAKARDSEPRPTYGPPLAGSAVAADEQSPRSETADILADREAALLARLGNDPATAPQESDEFPEDEGEGPELAAGDGRRVQQVTRSIGNDGREQADGLVWIEFAPNETQGRGHVSFCPPFPTVPEVEVYLVDGPSCDVRVSQTLTCGLRLDVRRLDSPRSGETVTIAFTAVAPPAPEG